jgi:hypothetical protein
MENQEIKTNGYDTKIIYNFKEYPDKKSGRCDNCGNAHFKSSASNGTFLRECRKCGMTKSI